MNRSVAALCPLLAIGLFAAAPAQAPAPFPPAVEDVLPASTYGVAQFGGLAACARAADQLPAAEIVHGFLANLSDTVRERNVDRWLDRAAEQVRQVLKSQGVAPGDVRAVLACPVVVGVGRPTIEGMGPSVALVFETGQHRDAIGRVVAALEAIGQRHGALAATADAELDGAAVHTWQLHDGPPIHLATLKQHFVVTNSRGYLREIAAVARGQAPSLAADSTLGVVRRHLAGTELAALFANTGPFCDMADPLLPYEVSEWADALGCGRLDGLFAGLSAGPHGGTDVLHLGLSGNAGGLLKVAASKPLDLSLAGACSKNTVAFGAVRVDVPGLIAAFDHLLDLLPAEVAAEARREIRRDLTRELRQAGTSPEELHAMLQAFGQQLTVALSLENGAVPKPELLVQVGVRDAGRVAALLQRVETMVARRGGLEWKERQVDDVTVRFLNVELDGKLKLSPCYALTRDALLLGSDTQCLVRALRVDAGDDSLAAQDDFAAMRRACDGASAVLHLRLFRAAELGWRTVETMVFPQLDAHADDLGFGSDALPDGETMAAALGTTTVAAFVDERGYTLKHQGTLGAGAWLAGLGALADEVLRRAATASKIY